MDIIVLVVFFLVFYIVLYRVFVNVVLYVWDNIVCQEGKIGEQLFILVLTYFNWVNEEKNLFEFKLLVLYFYID